MVHTTYVELVRERWFVSWWVWVVYLSIWELVPPVLLDLLGLSSSHRYTMSSSGPRVYILDFAGVYGTPSLTGRARTCFWQKQYPDHCGDERRECGGQVEYEALVPRNRFVLYQQSVLRRVGVVVSNRAASCALWWLTRITGDGRNQEREA
ncbi:hypothetical protein BDV59DRAFT_180882 [Aspergillus ambiguus]|uniref:uncharacterized protein n=1 Tax=Aspergillus ambiguus TaxID=176160 RepID=UPI003CCE1323